MDQFEEFEQRLPACSVCETMLPEAVDGTLSDAEQSAFDTHITGCAECARELAAAQRGAAWLSILKSHAPEPPDGLLAKILADTTGAIQPGSITIAAPTDSHLAGETAHRPTATKPYREPSSQWATLRNQLGDVFLIDSARGLLQPRMAMTAAMAFFSIALTLNLTGVRLRNLQASRLTPSALKRTMADADASATRIFQNNRAVYQVESRLSELSNDDAPGDASRIEDQ